MMKKETATKKLLQGVICGDVIREMEKLKNKGASFSCIYADPDYNVGVKYRSTSYKQQFDKYIDWCIEWSQLAHDLLDDDGNLFIINYPKNNSYLRVKYLDKAFYDVHEYVWVYNQNIGHSKRRFTTAHRSILHCRKSEKNKFYKENVAVPYENPKDKRIKEQIKNGSKGRMPYSWFYFNLVKNVSRDKTEHPCQIPQKLSTLLISSCTQPLDSILILFTGSGNDVISSIKLQRWVTTIDIKKEYCDLVKNRIKKLDIPLTYYGL